MKPRIFSYLVVVATTLLFIPSASASWSTFTAMGKTPVVGEPSCVQITTNEVMCVAQSQQHTLMANQFSNSTWSGWKNLAGTITSSPSCVNDASGNIVCATTSAKNTLGVVVFNGTKWGSLIDSGQQSFSNTYEAAAGPSCAVLHAGKVLCAIRNSAGSLVASLFSGKSWGKFSTIATSATTAPGCASDDNGNVICMADAIVNNLNATVVNRFDGAKWNGLLTLSNFPSSVNPVCTHVGIKGQADCFVDGYSNTVAYVTHFDGGNWQTSDWSGFGQVSGYVAPRTSCALLSAGSITCAWIDIPDSLLYVDTFNGTSWTGYVKVGGSPFVGGPTCTTFASGAAMCVTVGINNQTFSVTGP
jgi:hypothetical protein